MFDYKTKNKKNSGFKWMLYSLILFGLLLIAVPKYLIKLSTSIIEKNIPDTSTKAYEPPSKEIFVAINYLKMVNIFPGFGQKSAQGQKFVLDYYFPLFKKDYEKLKYACVDNAISVLSKQDTINKDSIGLKALSYGWKKYPDSLALSTFRKDWGQYHKIFRRSMPDYHYFIDINNLR